MPTRETFDGAIAGELSAREELRMWVCVAMRMNFALGQMLARDQRVRRAAESEDDERSIEAAA